MKFRKCLSRELPYLKEDIRFFAFDSFRGSPKLSGSDATGKTPQHWYEGSADLGGSEQPFINTLKENNVDLSKVAIVKGLFQDTLTEDLKKHALYI